MGFGIAVDPATMSRSRAGGITGVLFIETDGNAFPERGWSDFPVVVLGWWARAVCGVLDGAREDVCRFMDGPFSFSLQASSDRAWTIHLVGKQGQATTTTNAEPEDVAAAVARAADAVLATCSEKGWTSSDIDELRRSVGALRKR